MIPLFVVPSPPVFLQLLSHCGFSACLVCNFLTAQDSGSTCRVKTVLCYVWLLSWSLFFQGRQERSGQLKTKSVAHTSSVSVHSPLIHNILVLLSSSPSSLSSKKSSDRDWSQRIISDQLPQAVVIIQKFSSIVYSLALSSLFSIPAPPPPPSSSHLLVVVSLPAEKTFWLITFSVWGKILLSCYGSNIFFLSVWKYLLLLRPVFLDRRSIDHEVFLFFFSWHLLL